MTIIYTTIYIDHMDGDMSSIVRGAYHTEDEALAHAIMLMRTLLEGDDGLTLARMGIDSFEHFLELADTYGRGAIDFFNREFRDAHYIAVQSVKADF